MFRLYLPCFSCHITPDFSLNTHIFPPIVRSDTLLLASKIPFLVVHIPVVMDALCPSHAPKLQHVPFLSRPKRPNALYKCKVQTFITKSRNHVPAAPYAQAARPQSRSLGKHADQDPELSGRGKVDARDFNEERIRVEVLRLAYPRPTPPRVRGWKCAAPKLCIGQNASKRGEEVEDSNIGSWYQRRSKIGRKEWTTVFLTDPLDNDILSNSQGLTTWLQIREELRPTPRNRAATPSTASSPAVSVASLRASPANFPSSSSTLLPSSPVPPSPQSSAFDIGKEDKDYTRGVTLYMWKANNATHIPINLYPRQSDGYLHLWDHKLELGAHGIEAANQLDMYGGSRVGWNPLSWTTPLPVEFPGQKFFVKYRLVTSPVQFKDTFAVYHNTTHKGKGRAF